LPSDVGHIAWLDAGDAWPYDDTGGPDDAVCTATGYDGAILDLECLRAGDPPDVHAMRLRGIGPIVTEFLESLVGAEDLQVSFRYGMMFHSPGHYFVSTFTVRTSTGELLLLDSGGPASPGDSVEGLERAGWSDPFAELDWVDEGCAYIPNRPNTCPDAERPFALELNTDRGLVSVLDGQHTTIEVDGTSYEAIVTARIPTDDCKTQGPWAHVSLLRWP
jgi:hypothetical protein